MGQKGRTTLKEYFEAGKVPTEQQFAHLVDSFLNQNDDQLYIKTVHDQGSAKYLGVGAVNPQSRLTIRAHGAEENLISTENATGVERWKISQKIQQKPGLNIGESEVMESQLFIESGSGNIGINTINPNSKLEVNGSIYSRDRQDNDNGCLYLGDPQNKGARIRYEKSSDHLTISCSVNSNNHLVIKNDGKVGINTLDPSANLHVNGSIRLADGEAINQFSPDPTFATASHDKVPTSSAVKDYIRYHIRDELSAFESRASNSIQTRSSSLTPMPDMSLSFMSSGRPFIMLFKAGGVQVTERWANCSFSLVVDSIQVDYCTHSFRNTGWEARDVSLSHLMTLSPGTHQVEINWMVDNQALLNASYGSSDRELIVIEL